MKTLAAIMLLLGTVACAEPVPVIDGATDQCVAVMQPAEKDSFGMTFSGRTITTANKGTATAYLRGVPKQADASPSAIVTAHTSDEASLNSKVSFTVYPDQGCGTAGCRAGNNYEIVLQPTDSTGAKPIANCFVMVRSKVLKGPNK